MANIGEKLRERAQLLGLSDTEVARRVGLSQSRYANYVRDKREPDFATFNKICRVLGTTPNDVLGFSTDLGTQSDEARLRADIASTLHSLDRSQLQAFRGMIAALAASGIHDGPWLGQTGLAPNGESISVAQSITDLTAPPSLLSSPNDTESQVRQGTMQDDYRKLLMRIAMILEFYDVSNGTILTTMPDRLEDASAYLQSRFRMWLSNEAINWNDNNPLLSDSIGIGSRTPIVELLSPQGAEHNKKIHQMLLSADGKSIQLLDWEKASIPRIGEWTAVNDNLALATAIRGNHQIKIYLGGTNFQIKNGTDSFIISGIYSDTEECDPNGVPVEHYCRLIHYKPEHPLQGPFNIWERNPGR